MKCRWCNGTGGECGCGEGKCTHCGGSGAMVTPPFGAPALRHVLSQDDVLELASYWSQQYRDETLGNFIQRVAQRAVDTITKPPSSGDNQIPPWVDGVEGSVY